jgi:hypothetical protein
MVYLIYKIYIDKQCNMLQEIFLNLLLSMNILKIEIEVYNTNK